MKSGVEPFSSEHVREAALLFVEVFNGPPWNDAWSPATAEARILEIAETPGFQGVASRQDGALVGFAIGHLETSDGGPEFLLQEMCVHPSLQRIGVGTELVEALTQRSGVSRWYLLTDREGDAAKFYERLGFRPARRIGVFLRDA